MEAGTIPATVNCTEPMAVAGSGVKVVTRNSPLRMDSSTTVAVNSIGLTGEMGHVVLKPNLKEGRRCEPAKELPRLVPIASRTEKGALKAAQRIQSYPFDPEYLRLVQDVFSSNVRGYEFRSFCICPPLPGDDAPVVAKVEKRSLWYVYSGMGSQWAGMGAGLMALPIFRDTIERLHAVLEPRGVNLKEVVTETGPGAFDNILKSFVGITACQIALTNVLRAMDLAPDGIIGHSVGELGCAFADGCLTEEQTILAAWARGVASNRATLIKGMMAAVGLGFKEIVNILPPSVDVACRNSSTSTTISGPAEDVARFVEELVEKGIFARAVKASDIAYHSRYIQPAAPYLREFLRDVILHPRKRSSKWVSTSVPQEQWDQPSAQLCSAEYLTNNLLSPVLFEDGLQYVPQHGLLVEVAPHGLLQSILKRELPGAVHVALCQRNSETPIRTLLNAVGSLSVSGANPVVSALYPAVSFPVARGTPPLSPLVHWYHDTSQTFMDVALKCDNFVIRRMNSPHMKLRGVPLVALSEMLEMVWECQARIRHTTFSATKVVFENIRVFSYEAFLTDDGTATLTASINSGTGRFEVFVDDMDPEAHFDSSGGVRMLAWGSIRVLGAEEEERPRKQLPQPTTKGTDILSSDDILRDFASRGLTYSDRYKSLESIAVGAQDWQLHIRRGKSMASLLEAALQAALLRHMEEGETLVLAKTVQRLEVDPALLLDRAVSVQYHVSSGIMQAPGLYVAGLTSREAQLVRPLGDVCRAASSLTFVPFGKTSLQSYQQFLSLAAQMALEAAPGAEGLRAVLLQDGAGTGSDRLAAALRGLGVRADVQELGVESQSQSQSPPELRAGEARLWLSGPRTLQRAARLVARSGGLLLARCPSASPAHAALPLHLPLRVLAEQRLDGDWLGLLCRAEPPPADVLVVELGPRDPLPARVSAAAVLVWRGQPAGGVAAVVEEVQRRRYAQLCRLVFVLDEAAPPFSLSEPLYAQQLQLQQPVNVLHRGRWGCWRALPLPLPDTPLTAAPARCLGDVRFSAIGLNPHERKDKAGCTSWRGPVDYVGCTASGQRVMGVARWSSDKARPRVDPVLRWAVPESWSDEEAATVPFVYATAYLALRVYMRARRGESIVILGGASALGQAAIRVALQLGCSPIFVTVSSEAERRLVCEHFPQVEPGRVLSGERADLQVRRLSGGRGVRLALSQEAPEAALRCLWWSGRLAHCGRTEGLAGDVIGLYTFGMNASMYGLCGDHLSAASARDRAALVELVREGIRSGVVQPVVGARTLSAARPRSTEGEEEGEGEGSFRDDTECSKVVIKETTNGAPVWECDPKKSYLIVGGDQHEWLQVAGWLALQGARTVIAVPGGGSSGALVDHRTRSFHQQFGASVRVVPVISWEKATAEEVVQVAAASAPVDAVLVLSKDQDDAALPALLHAALSEHPGAALVVLAERPQTARALASLCEARRGAGLRAACVSGPLYSALDHLADAMSGARPPVTLVGEPSSAGAPSQDGEGEPLLASGVPSCAEDLAALGSRLQSLPRRGVRLRGLRGARGAASARESPPVFYLPPLGVLDSDSADSLSELAARLVSPLVCVEYRPAADLHQLALSIVQELTASWPTGPFNLLGLSMSNPLTLEVSRCLEDVGHNVVTFLVDGDVLELKSWASLLSDVQLLRTALREQDGAMEVLEDADAADSAGWDGLVARVLPLLQLQLQLQPRCLEALRAVRTAARSIALHQPRVAQPVRCHLLPVRTRASEPCCFSATDSNVEPMVMPDGEAQLGFRSGWLATKLNENCGWSKLANQKVVRKIILGK